MKSILACRQILKGNSVDNDSHRASIIDDDRVIGKIKKENIGNKKTGGYRDVAS